MVVPGCGLPSLANLTSKDSLLEEGLFCNSMQLCVYNVHEGRGDFSEGNYVGGSTVWEGGRRVVIN